MPTSTHEDAKKLGVVSLGKVYVIPKSTLARKLNGSTKTTSATPFKVSSKGILQLPALMLANVSC